MYRLDEIDMSFDEHGQRIARFTIDSNLLPVVTIDTYSTFTGYSTIESEIEYWANEEAPDASLEPDDFESTVDFGDLKRDLAVTVVDWINENTGPIAYGFDDPVPVVTFGAVNSTYSPKYYNFESDSFNADVTVNVTELVKWLRAEHGSIVDAIESYADEHFKSYDGFMSFVTGALMDERRAGTMLWLGLHMYLADQLDWGDFLMHMKEAESEIYTEHTTITLKDEAWTRIACRRAAERIGVDPEHDDVTVPEWRAWVDAIEQATQYTNGEPCDLLHTAPELSNFDEYMTALVGAIVKCVPTFDHIWQHGRATGTMTCERCGLLPTDDDDTSSPCEFWKKG